MGRITGIPVKVGDQVKAGQTLVEVDDELKLIAVEQARAALLAAETNLAKARRDVERAEKLFAAGDVADVELEGNRLAYRSADAQAKGAAVNLKYAERQLADTRIKSPVAGSVAAKMVELGEMVTPGKVVANIVDTGNLKVLVSIPEDQIGKVRVSQEVSLQVDSDPGRTFHGTVASVGSKADARSAHTYPVEIAVGKEATGRFKVGMFARVEIQASNVANALTIPKEALMGGKEKPSVFVVVNDVAKAQPVKLGITNGERHEVVEGLKEGDLVVTFGSHSLKDGTPVQHR
jgi:RND family efflux transporter MFP subunit